MGLRRDPNKRNRIRNKGARIWEIKGKSECAHCGFKHPAALHFHHIGGKMSDIGQMMHDDYSIEKIFEEMRKCIILCANCHAIEHYNTNYMHAQKQFEHNKNQLRLDFA